MDQDIERCARCLRSVPASDDPRSDYWQEKFDTNVERDERVVAQLEKAGWRVVTIWECETKDNKCLPELLRSIFNLQNAD